jgi:two-component sensor histidine kinase
MKPMSERRQRWMILGLILGGWTLLAVVLATHYYLVLYVMQHALADLIAAAQSSLNEALAEATFWPGMVRRYLIECYLWCLLAFIIFWLRRRFPLDQRHWLRSCLVHLPASAGIALLESALLLGVSQLLSGESLEGELDLPVLLLICLFMFPINVFYYWVILGVSQTLEYYRRYRQRELQTSQLEARLAQTQLQVLKMQLHPHFLFNTLNAISALIHQDVEVADRMIARLGELLRSTLENADRQEVPLKQELDFIQPYVEIEKARLGPRLTVEMEVDPAAMDARVPNLILQPLVENAIRHGIAPRPEPGRIAIRARRERNVLHLVVHDDGPGLAQRDGAPVKEGIGLANTRARLQQLYGADHSFQLSNGAGRGLMVVITIPFREANGDGTAEADRDHPDPDR